MKWQQRVRVITGFSCTRIVLSMTVLILLVIGWLTANLVQVASALCVLYALAFVLMFVFQRQGCQQLRGIGDFFEELTTDWYFAVSLIALWLLSGVMNQHFLLVLIGLAMLAGPALVSLLVKEHKQESGNFASEQDERR